MHGRQSRRATGEGPNWPPPAMIVPCSPTTGIVTASERIDFGKQAVQKSSHRNGLSAAWWRQPKHVGDERRHPQWPRGRSIAEQSAALPLFIASARAENPSPGPSCEDERRHQRRARRARPLSALHHDAGSPACPRAACIADDLGTAEAAGAGRSGWAASETGRAMMASPPPRLSDQRRGAADPRLEQPVLHDMRLLLQRVGRGAVPGSVEGRVR